MIDSNNIDVIRKNIKELAAVSDPDVINNLITNVDANTDAIGDINSLIGSTPLPQGKTLSNSIVKSIEVVGTTNNVGGVALPGVDKNLIINAIVVNPTRHHCFIDFTSESVTTPSVFVYDRNGNPLNTQEVHIRVLEFNS